MLRFAVAIFLGAFLVFQVQPILGKYILPWFGGGASVWTTCMLFFQVGLLLGYLYAHLLTRYLRRAGQAWLHLALLAASLLCLPNPAAWKPAPDQEPITGILLLLAVNVGPQFVLLSATGPLLQAWFSNTFPGRSPYRLYALSNVASLLALVGYPFVVEPWLTLAWQLALWKGMHVAFVAACGWCALRFALHRKAMTNDRMTNDQRVVESLDIGHSSLDISSLDIRTVLLWLALAACGSAMLLATTNQLCQEVAVVPFLWILPLAVYLVSFIICFDNPRWYDRIALGIFLLFMLPWACVALYQGIDAPLSAQVVIYTLTLFACCMTCHGELVRAKPEPQHLTMFYLMIALGGALGGVFVALVAPLLFLGYWEYHLALAGCCMATFVAWHRDGFLVGGKWLSRGVTFAALGIGQAALVAVLALHAYFDQRSVSFTTRNFYGVLRVKDALDGDDSPELIRQLIHGRISHGFQYHDAFRQHEPTSYYTDNSGVGQGLRLCRQDRHEGLRIGVIGLGTGTLAAQARLGEVVRFYEINPAVKKLSDRAIFSYLLHSPADVEVVLGDARVRLEQELRDERPQEFDLLAVDAFSSDAIPIHLLTRECGEIYWRHLKPDGVLALHISNRFLDLGPVTRGLAAQRENCQALRFSAMSNDRGSSGSTWVLLTSNPKVLAAVEKPGKEDELLAEIYSPWTEDDPPPLLWTDDFHSLWQALRKDDFEKLRELVAR